VLKLKTGKLFNNNFVPVIQSLQEKLTKKLSIRIIIQLHATLEKGSGHLKIVKPLYLDILYKYCVLDSDGNPSVSDKKFIYKTEEDFLASEKEMLELFDTEWETALEAKIPISETETGFSIEDYTLLKDVLEIV